MTVGLGIYQVNILLDRIIAEALIPGDGALSALYLGDRLMQLPQALVGIAVATAVFPELSRFAARGEGAGLARCLGQALELCLALALPAAVGLALLARPTIQLFFQEEGNFDLVMVERTTWVVVILAVAVVATSVNHILVRGFYALGDTRTPVRVGAAVVGVNLVCNLALVWSFREQGLALATVISTAVNGVLLTLRLRGRLPELELQTVLGQALRAGGACLGMAAVVWVCLAHVLAPPDGSTLNLIGRVAVPVLVGVGVYAILAPLLGVRAVAQLIARRATIR
jgi:putative peptidoglycan lipid II flippase